MNMNQRLTIAPAVTAIGLILALLLPIAATAQNGRGGGPPPEVQARVAEIRQQAQERAESARAQGQERSQEAREQACTNRQAALERVMGTMTSRAENFKSVFDRIYERVQGFYESGQLTVDNYDELKSNVDDAQEEAAIAVDAMTELEVDLDCEDPNVADNVAAFRDGLQDARNAVHDYRSELVALISALRAEAAEENADETADTEEEIEEEADIDNEESDE